jgi:hypothetical protein
MDLSVDHEKTVEELKSAGIVHPDDRPRFVTSLRSATKGGNSPEMKHCLRRIEGGYRLMIDGIAGYIMTRALLRERSNLSISKPWIISGRSLNI